jgi:hypothetical protein
MTEIRLESHIQEAVKMMKDGGLRLMKEAVNIVRTQTLETLSGSRSGRQYKIPGTQRYYTASAPGEAPAQRLGELRQHVSTDVQMEDGAPVGYVGVPLIETPKGDKEDIGTMLEKGTKKMAPRPWLEPSFEKAKDAVIKNFSKPWEEK